MVTMRPSWLEQFLPKSRVSAMNSLEMEEMKKETVEVRKEEKNLQKKEMMEISSEAISTSTYKRSYESQKFTFGVCQGLVPSWPFHSFTNLVYPNKQSMLQSPIGSKLLSKEKPRIKRDRTTKMNKLKQKKRSSRRVSHGIQR
jgi:hypothetical protein